MIGPLNMFNVFCMFLSLLIIYFFTLSIQTWNTLQSVFQQLNFTQNVRAIWNHFSLFLFIFIRVKKPHVFQLVFCIQFGELREFYDKFNAKSNKNLHRRVWSNCEVTYVYIQFTVYWWYGWLMWKSQQP